MMAMMLQDTLFNSQLIERAIQDENNTAKLVKQLQASKILTTGCATKANKEVARKFAALKPIVKKK